MRSERVTGDSRLSLWLRVREFAVPPSMIETATARRATGDWAGACAAARIDVDLNLRAVARTHGRQVAAQLRRDLRHLAPDLLRWHMPRIAPDGLLRPGLTIDLARYQTDDPGRTLHLVVRTPPAWADAGQRITLALWDGSRSGPHPHPRPDPRFRLDLHRHLWDARRTGELRTRSGMDQPSMADHPDTGRLRARGCAVDRWAAEASILLDAEGRRGEHVVIRLGARQRLVLELADTDRLRRITAVSPGRASPTLPVLPDAATWVPPDLVLLRAGLIRPDRLHPLVAAALAPDHPPADARAAPEHRAGTRLVECRGAWHRIGLVNGVLVPLDHDPAEIRREELLAALTGTPLPCLQAIDTAHRHPECLVDVRARLDHGDVAGALAVVEDLLGPDALLRTGALRDELERAARRQVAYGLFRAGLADTGPPRGIQPPRRPDRHRARPRHAQAR